MVPFPPCSMFPVASSTSLNASATVFANAGIAEYPWLPVFDPSTAASRPFTKPNLLTVNIDLVGQLNTAALAFQIFERQEKNEFGLRGKLIMTASVFGYYPCPSMPMYAAAKAGVVNFMRSAAEFYKTKDITVNLGMSRSSVVSSTDGAFGRQADSFASVSHGVALAPLQWHRT